MNTYKKILLAFSMTAVASFGSVCSTSNGEITNASGSCYLTPTVYQFKLHRLSFCSSAPAIMNIPLTDEEAPLQDGYKLDLSMCDAIVYDNPSGQIVNATVGSNLDLKDVNLKNINGKTYTYYVFEVDKDLSQKVIAKMATNMTGGHGTGNYCWTNNKSSRYTQVESRGFGWWNNANRETYWTTDCGNSIPAGAPFLTTNIVDMGGKVVQDGIRTTLRLIPVDDTYTVHTDGSLTTKLIFIYPLDTPIKFESINSLDINIQVTNSVDFNPRVEHDNLPTSSTHNQNTQFGIFGTGVFSFSIDAK